MQALAKEQPKTNISEIVSITNVNISKITNVPKINNISGIAEEALNVVGETQFLDLENDDLIDPSDPDKDVNMADANDINACNYDWLADSGSTLHITNQKKYYQTFILTTHIIKGVRGKVGVIQIQHGLCKQSAMLAPFPYLSTIPQLGPILV